MFLKIRNKLVGLAPICNMRPDRAPHIGKWCFILCWRCTAISIGVVLASLFKTRLTYLLATLLLVPTIIDGVLQYKYEIASNNVRRVSLGLIAGIGIGYILNRMINK